MKKIISAILAFFTLAMPFCTIAHAGKGDFILGDHPDLVKSYSGLEDKLGINTAHSGDTINIGGVKFKKGFGLHCNPSGTESYIEIDISGLDYEYFAAYVGVQSVSKDNIFLDWGSIAFQVYCDGVLTAFSEVCKYKDAPALISCPVKGVKTLKLVQDCVDGHSCDWGVWGDAMLTDTEPQKEDVPEPEFTPDKTDKITPEEITKGDFVYAGDMYWSDNATFTTNYIRRDANTANEWILDSTFRVFDKGLGMHASSDSYTTYIEINIEGMGFKKFASYYGICATMTAYDISMAEVKFAVFGDGNKLFESEVKKYGEAFDYMECDISNVSKIKIAIAGAPGISGAWGTWGGAVLIRQGEGTEILKETDGSELFKEETTLAVDEHTTAAEVPQETVTETETRCVTEEETNGNTVPEETTGETKPSGCAGAVAGFAVAATVAGCSVVLKKERRDDEK